MKQCTVCGRRKPVSAFPPQRGRCRACLRSGEQALIEASRRWIDDYARRWRDSADGVIGRANAFVRGRRSDGEPDRRFRAADGPPHYYYRLRHETMLVYGGYRCACCGEGEPMFLTLDHVNNDGSRHRRAIGSFSSPKMFAWLRARDYPPGFQVLCSNCNHGRHRNGGTCPHRARPATETAVRVGRDGRIRLPAALRARLGDRLAVEERADGSLVLRRHARPRLQRRRTDVS